VLKALDERGMHVAGADLLVGTSAGAVLSAYLAAGWTPSDFHDYANGRHRRSARTEAEQEDEVRRLFVPLYGNNVDRARRYAGSLYAMMSSRGWAPKAPPARFLRRAFPSGLYSTDETRRRFMEDLPERWPDRDVYLCAADLYGGERVAFGAHHAPRVSFPEAVLASTAIPGVFPPVRLGDRYYVDGGVVSATSLDLAAYAGCDRILCIAPLGFRRDAPWAMVDPRRWGSIAVRTPFVRTLRREVRAARTAGVEVLVIRPWVNDLQFLGGNAMRHHDRAMVVEVARSGTHRLMDVYEDHPVVEAMAAMPA